MSKSVAKAADFYFIRFKEVISLRTISQLLIESTKVLKKNINNPSPRLDSEVILANLLKVDRSYLLLNGDKTINNEVLEAFHQSIERRLQGEPVAYIIGQQEFMGMTFYVDNRVLIPRPDTEILVELITQENKRRGELDLGVLDLGTGSGDIGLSIAKILPKSKVTMTDISQDALEVAKLNAGKLDIQNVELIQSDFFTSINDKRFQIIVSNPPYIVTKVISQLQREVYEYEPALALDGGVDGLKYYRRIIKESKKYLYSGGLLFVEIGYDQGEAVTALFAKNDYRDIQLVKDLAGHDRVVFAKTN